MSGDKGRNHVRVIWYGVMEFVLEPPVARGCTRQYKQELSAGNLVVLPFRPKNPVGVGGSRGACSVMADALAKS